jgi:(2Fe-2S) ferredoxin
MDKAEFVEDKEILRKQAPVMNAPLRHHVFVCNGRSCTADGSAEVKAAFERELKSRNLQYGKESKGRNPHGSVVLTDCGSVGFCAIGVAVLVYPDGIWYGQVSAEDVPEIIEKHLVEGKVVKRLALIQMSSEEASF